MRGQTGNADKKCGDRRDVHWIWSLATGARSVCPDVSSSRMFPYKASGMNESKALWRIGLSLLISLILNCVLVAIEFSIDPRQEKLSAVQNIVVGLLKPAEALTTRFVPGHSGAQIVSMIVFSFAVYALIAWVGLSLPVWWRRRI